jgi:hypothetical protein
MPVPQQLVIDRIRARCDELEDRYPGYRRDLVGYLAEVLSYERAAERNVVKRVEAQLEAFGDLYHRRLAGEAEQPGGEDVSNAPKEPGQANGLGKDAEEAGETQASDVSEQSGIEADE